MGKVLKQSDYPGDNLYRLIDLSFLEAPKKKDFKDLIRFKLSRFEASGQKSKKPGLKP